MPPVCPRHDQYRHGHRCMGSHPLSSYRLSRSVQLRGRKRDFANTGIREVSLRTEAFGIWSLLKQCWYDNLALRGLLADDTSFHQCPNPDCMNEQIVEGPLPIFDCSACRQRYCIEHRVAWHAGETCHMYHNRMELDTQEEPQPSDENTKEDSSEDEADGQALKRARKRAASDAEQKSSNKRPRLEASVDSEHKNGTTSSDSVAQQLEDDIERELYSIGTNESTRENAQGPPNVSKPISKRLAAKNRIQLPRASPW